MNYLIYDHAETETEGRSDVQKQEGKHCESRYAISVKAFSLITRINVVYSSNNHGPIAQVCHYFVVAFKTKT